MAQGEDELSGYDVEGFGAFGKAHCTADKQYICIHARQYACSCVDSDELMSRSSYCILPSRMEMSAPSCAIL